MVDERLLEEMARRLRDPRITPTITTETLRILEERGFSLAVMEEAIGRKLRVVTPEQARVELESGKARHLCSRVKDMPEPPAQDSKTTLCLKCGEEVWMAGEADPLKVFTICLQCAARETGVEEVAH